MLLIIYRFISIIIAPLLYLLVLYRVYKKKDCNTRYREKFGIANVDLLASYSQANISNLRKKNVIWIHAVSVGETNSVLQIAKSLIDSDVNNFILFTTTTTTAARVAFDFFTPYRNQAIHQFLPIDSYFWIKKFINFWQPKIICMVESEIWPNMLDIAKSNNIKIFLINCRFSQKSYKSWLFFSKLNFRPFDNFTEIFAQSQQIKDMLSKISKTNIHFLGNIKAMNNISNANKKLVRELDIIFEGKKIIMAASTHKGEDEIIIKIFNKIVKKLKRQDLLLILAIRHPERREEVMQYAKLNGVCYVSSRHLEEKVDYNTECYIVDTIGELESFYAIADFTFIGGSLIAGIGGHNPIEAIINNCAVIVGPYYENNKDLYQNLIDSKGCIKINDEVELMTNFINLIDDDNLAGIIANRALESHFGNFCNDNFNKIITILNQAIKN